MSISAMKQALDLLETSWGDGHEDTLKYWNETAQVLRQAIAEAEDAVAAEREACANVCEDLIGTRAMARHCADAIRARGEWVKTYCGGKPNYTTPFECPRCGHCCRVDWVGLTDEEISNLFFNGDSSLGVKTMSASDVWLIKMTENLLREKNVPQP